MTRLETFTLEITKAILTGAEPNSLDPVTEEQFAKQAVALSKAILAEIDKPGDNWHPLKAEPKKSGQTFPVVPCTP